MNNNQTIPGGKIMMAYKKAMQLDEENEEYIADCHYDNPLDHSLWRVADRVGKHRVGQHQCPINNLMDSCNVRRSDTPSGATVQIPSRSA